MSSGDMAKQYLLEKTKDPIGDIYTKKNSTKERK